MNAAEILDHLSRRLPRLELAGDPVPLPGGLLNEVWRVPARPHGVVVKHAPPHIATAPQVPLDPVRLAFEARALFDLAPGGRLAGVSEERVRPPLPIDFDGGAHVLVMEDLGETTALFDFAESEPAEAERRGAALGRFIGRLHATTCGREEFAREYRNDGIQRTRLEVQYRTLAEWLRAAGFAARVADAAGSRACALGERLLLPGSCLVMGDLWPPSVRVAGEKLRIIDWEFTHYGQPLQDLAHLAAHAFLHAHYAASPTGRGAVAALWRAFARAYEADAGAVDAVLSGTAAVRGFATHVAAEILVRTAGPFAESYLHRELSRDEGPRRDAIERAVALLLDDGAPRPLTEWVGLD